MQLELIEPPALEVRPATTSAEPRLWIRRLMIWSAPGVVLRDIRLRPGLNIVWSPDPADGGTQVDGHPSASGPGHGAGKTLVCRLLRYCLGEPNIAPEEQRAKIVSACRHGRVGAEVVLDNVVWAVVRSIGVMRHDLACENQTLDDVADDREPTGMAPLTEAIARRILTPGVAGLIADDLHDAWLMAIAWLARDQECRFNKVTEWRSAASNSGSPARRHSVGDATKVIRALVGALTPEEHALEADIEELDRKRSDAALDSGRQQWMLTRSVASAARSLGLRVGDLPAEGLVVGALRTAAREHVARVSIVDAKGEPASLADLEAQHDEAVGVVHGIERTQAHADAEAKIAEARAKQIMSETPGLSASLDEAEMPTCPICEVPVDRALADGCKLSHRLPDELSLRRRRTKNQEDLLAAREASATAQRALSRLASEHEAARATAIAAWEKVIAVRQLREQRAEAWYAARRVGEEVADIERMIESKAESEGQVASIDGGLEKKRAEIGAQRDRHAQVFARLGRLFDPLVRELLGAGATGRVDLDGNGLHLAVECGGERSTPAIDTVKILAFDLAAMCRSIEGDTYLPAFLIHDSPREADLGLSIYHRLFRLVVGLERLGPAPLFQYIVTTTTRPPEELCADPWLRVEIQGTPSEERLLRRDL